MKFRPAILLSLSIVFLALTESCITRKDISYFQDISDSLSIQRVSKDFEAIIKFGGYPIRTCFPVSAKKQEVFSMSSVNEQMIR